MRNISRLSFKICVPQKILYNKDFKTIAEFMEGSIESELDEELGYEPYDNKNKTTDNSRNGHSKKTLRTSMGKQD